MVQVVSCPKCGRRSRAPAAVLGKRVKCPDCATLFIAAACPPAAAKEESVKTKPGAGDGEDIEVVGDGDEPEDEEEDRSRARKRWAREEEDEEEEERPRKRKKKRRRAAGEGPWLIAVGVAGAFLVIAFLISIVANGTMGLEPAKDGPLVKCLGLGLGLLVALAMTGLGVVAVRKREMWTRYGFSAYTITGTAAVVLGLFQTAVGGCLCGWIVYGLVFTLIRGR